MTKIKETSTNFANKKALTEECPELYASRLIGGQWSLAICSYLVNGKLRFGELRKSLGNITERMAYSSTEGWKKIKLLKNGLCGSFFQRFNMN